MNVFIPLELPKHPEPFIFFIFISFSFVFFVVFFRFCFRIQKRRLEILRVTD